MLAMFMFTSFFKNPASSCYGTILNYNKYSKGTNITHTKYLHKLGCEGKQTKNKQSDGKVDKKVDKVK